MYSERELRWRLGLALVLSTTIGLEREPRPKSHPDALRRHDWSTGASHLAGAPVWADRRGIQIPRILGSGRLASALGRRFCPAG
jgi:hypothetical protein